MSEPHFTRRSSNGGGSPGGPVSDPVDIPSTAAWLGAGGALPFLGGAAAAAFDPGVIGAQAVAVVIVYGAVILSFLGGVFWGIAVVRGGPVGGGDDRDRLLLIGVMPSLAGWGAALAPASAACFLLAAIFLLVLFADRWAAHRRWMPRWWMRLRVRLSLIVAAFLTITGMLA